MTTQTSTEQLKSIGKRTVWISAVLVAVLYLYGSLKPVIYDETEGQYAGAAKEMLERGDWLIPSNNGVPRFQKPPIQYWLMMGSMKVFGVNEFAARLPNALATLAWLAAVYLLGCRISGPTLGYYAALMLACACGFFVFCHVIMPEPIFSFCVTMAIWALLSGWFQRQDRKAVNRWMILAWLFMGFGSMTKGLHAMAWPVASVLVAAVLLPSARGYSKALWNVIGIGLFFLILLPWYVAVEFQFPGFVRDQFFNEQIGHAINQRWPPSSNQVHFGIYIIQHVFMLCPPMLFLPAALRSAWMDRAEIETQTKLDHFPLRFLIIWFGVTFLTTLFSARQDYYTMSAWGVWGIVLAWAWVSRAKIRHWYYTVPFLILCFVGLILSLGGSWLWLQDENLTIEVLPIVERDHLWNALNGFSLGAWRDFSPLMIGTGLSLFAGSLVALWWVRLDQIRLAGISFFALMVIPYLMMVEGFSVKEDYFSLKKTADFLNETAEAEAIVVYSGYPNLASSLFFYLERNVHWIGVPVEYEYATRSHDIGREYYLDLDQLKQLWGETPVYLIAEESEVEGWTEKLGFDPPDSYPVVSGTRVLISNQ
ncbi:MAG: glycosyltransferase family 39 protein [Verrucomicrobiota bacterium]